MRISSLHDKYAAEGAQFEERFGIEVVSNVKDVKTEYSYIRDTVGLTDFSHMQIFLAPEETGLDFIDSIMAGNVAKIRFGRVLHTFLPDSDGNILADCYIANNDDEFIILCESIADDSTIRSIFLADESSGVKELTGTEVVFSIDGFNAWKVAKELFGSDVLGLPYLSVETYTYEDTPVKLFRAGKTSEFGYLLTAPVAIGSSLMDTLSELIKKQGGGLCGVNIHNDLRLEGRFFNIFSEGIMVKDPLSLGLQWMIDFDKDSFTGHDSILERRKKGLSKKIVGISTSAAINTKIGDAIFSGDTEIGKIQCTCFSHSLDLNVGLALLNVETAYAGLSFRLNSSEGPEVKTISMPPIMPKSLSVKLDEI